MGPTTVQISVPYAEFVEAVRTQIEQHSDIEIVAVMMELPLSLAAACALRPDVLLLDPKLLGGDTRVLRQLHEQAPATKVLLCCDCNGECCAANVIEHGVKGCLPRDSLPESCLRAIRAVQDGEVWIGRKALVHALRELITTIQRPGEQALSEALTQRESQILGWIKLGLTNKEVGRKLGISHTTVKTHLQHIYAKLHVTRRVQL